MIKSNNTCIDDRFRTVALERLKPIVLGLPLSETFL
jgi:hypothetical protein